MIRCPVVGAEDRAKQQEELRRAQNILRNQRDKYRLLYGRASWKNLVIWKLNRNAMCESPGCTEPARVVHHVQDHRGDVEKFFDRENLAALCKKHHDEITARRVNESKAGK